MDEQTCARSGPTIDEIIEVAAGWWERAVRGEEGWGSTGVGIADLMFSAVVTRTGEDDARKFGEALRRLLRVRLERSGETWLRVDYGPEGLLADAVRQSGARVTGLPLKTSITVTPQAVVVSVGYRASDVVLIGSAS